MSFPHIKHKREKFYLFTGDKFYNSRRQENSENLNQSELREKTHAWQTRYNEKLDEFFENGNQSREALMGLIWEYGIMECLIRMIREKRKLEKNLKERCEKVKGKTQSCVYA